MKGSKEGFTQHRVEEDSLKLSWNVDVQAIYALGFMVGEVIGLNAPRVSSIIKILNDPRLTRKVALYGMPMGRFAKIASKRLARGDLKAKLWDISCMARNRFWFAVPPMAYAVKKKVHDKIGVDRKAYTQKICRATTARTRYLVFGSGPQSLVT